MALNYGSKEKLFRFDETTTERRFYHGAWMARRTPLWVIMVGLNYALRQVVVFKIGMAPRGVKNGGEVGAGQLIDTNMDIVWLKKVKFSVSLTGWLFPIFPTPGTVICSVNAKNDKDKLEDVNIKISTIIMKSIVYSCVAPRSCSVCLWCYHWDAKASADPARQFYQERWISRTATFHTPISGEYCSSNQKYEGWQTTAVPMATRKENPLEVG